MCHVVERLQASQYCDKYKQVLIRITQDSSYKKLRNLKIFEMRLKKQSWYELSILQIEQKRLFKP